MCWLGNCWLRYQTANRDYCNRLGAAVAPAERPASCAAGTVVPAAAALAHGPAVAVAAAVWCLHDWIAAAAAAAAVGWPVVAAGTVAGAAVPGPMRPVAALAAVGAPAAAAAAAVTKDAFAAAAGAAEGCRDLAEGPGARTYPVCGTNQNQQRSGANSRCV